MNLESYVVSWSPRKEVFHIEKVSDMLKANRRTLATSSKTDYIPLGFYDTHDDAVDEVTRIKNHQKSNSIELV